MEDGGRERWERGGKRWGRDRWKEGEVGSTADHSPNTSTEPSQMSRRLFLENTMSLPLGYMAT